MSDELILGHSFWSPLAFERPATRNLTGIPEYGHSFLLINNEIGN